MQHEQATPPDEQLALERIQTSEVSRARFLKMVGGAGAVGAMGMLLAACGEDESDNRNGSSGGTTTEEETETTEETDASSTEANGDLEIVNYALTLEYLEADFYRQVIDSGLFKGAELELVKAIGDHEQQHVDALTGVANELGTAVEAPKTQFPLESREEVLKLAATVENVGAAAYLGQAANIKSEDILAAALAIHANEARHAAALNTMVGRPFTPDGAFAKPMDMAAVLEAVKPFIVS